MVSHILKNEETGSTSDSFTNKSSCLDLPRVLLLAVVLVEVSESYKSLRAHQCTELLAHLLQLF